MSPPRWRSKSTFSLAIRSSARFLRNIDEALRPHRVNAYEPPAQVGIAAGQSANQHCEHESFIGGRDYATIRSGWQYKLKVPLRRNPTSVMPTSSASSTASDD